MDQLRETISLLRDENDNLKAEIDKLCFGTGEERDTLDGNIRAINRATHEYSLYKEL